MSETTTPRSRVQRLASLIEQDLRRRGLAAGDPYLTASEAGDDFGVDPFTATRAMSLLAKRGVLVRKRGVGTFVGRCESGRLGPGVAVHSHPQRARQG